MTQLAVSSPVPIKLELGNALRLSDDELFELCARNKDLRIERTPGGDLIVMSPAGFKTASRNNYLARVLGNWAEADGTGIAVDSSAGFRLPNGAMRAPDAAWVRRERLEPIPAEAQEKFLPLAPDFAIELVSPSGKPEDEQEKVEEYLAGGTLLAWIIDPFERRVHVFRAGHTIEVLEEPTEVSGDPELPGFVLDLRPIWQSTER